jgi:hypothetical protein
MRALSHRFAKRGCVRRLDQKVNRAELHRLHARLEVAVAGEENHRRRRAEARQVLLQLEARHARHLVVEHDAADRGERLALDELVRCRVRHDRPALRREQPHETLAH